MNYPQQSYQAMDAQTAAQQAGAQPLDLIAMLWRWKWLPVLGVLLGVASAWLYWITLPSQFLAVAKIQVVTPGSHGGMPMLSLDTGDNHPGGRADDVVIIQSKVVLRNAIEIGRLQSNPKLSDKDGESLMAWIRNKDRLTVRPGTKEAITNIIDVMFRCDDRELAAEVVNSIIAGYEKFIGREAQLLSGEVLDKLARFRDDYDLRAKAASDEYLRLIRASSLLKIGDEFKDLDTEALLGLTAKISDIESKAGRYQSAIETAEQALKREDPSYDSLLLMLARATNDPSLLRNEDPLAKEYQLDNFLKTENNSAHLHETLEQLKDNMRAESAVLGEDHPFLGRNRERIAGLEKRLGEARESEAMSRQVKEEKMRSLNLEMMAPEDRIKIVLNSLHEELASLNNEQDRLIRSAEDHRAKSKEQQYAINELDVHRQEMNSINDSAKELKTALERLNMGTGYGSKVMKRLEVPEQGYEDGPYWWKYLALGGFIGACFFTGLAYLLELADRSYRGPDEIARDLGVPILGHIQMSTLTRKDRKDEKIDLSLVTFHKAKSTASEAYRGVRTAVYFGNQAGSIKVIQITSPVPGDGKSTVAANLASSIAQSGRRTLLMDCDMRRPRLAKLIGVRDDLGLTNILAGKLKLEDALQPTAVPNMDILTCGRRPGNPAELMLSDDFVDVVNSLREKYDYIIMDTPPILAVSDPANASACSDGIILTLRLRRNLRPIAIRAAQMLQSVNANLMGVVINGVTGRAGYGYGGYRYDGARASIGYGGYGYGATYGYGDYYSSSMAESVVAGARPSANGNGQPMAVKPLPAPGNTEKS